MFVWWRARSDGYFILMGVGEPWSSTLGPLLPALSAGLTAAMALSLVDAAAGTIAGIVAAVAVMLLPGFMPLHRTSLTGPPLTAVTLTMIGVMLHAPRFSIAYGILAATAAVFIAPAGVGLVLAAVAWAWWVEGARPGDRLTRLALASLPLLLAAVLALKVGSTWPATLVFGWHGNLDEGLHAAGVVFGDQLAPNLSVAVRWFAVADLTLLLIALGVVTWRRIEASPRADTVSRRLLPALLITALGLIVGLVVTWLALPLTPLPTLEELFPLLGILVVATVASVATLWPRWPRWGKAAVLIVVMGWAQAALRA